MTIPEDQYPDHRVCSECKIDKPLDEFKKDNTCLYGRTRKCKRCFADYKKVWSEANSEQKAETDRLYREKNRERNREKARIRREKNPEYNKNWFDAHPGYSKKQGSEYQRNNRERVNLKNHNYRARKAGLEGSFTIDEWIALLDFCGNSCVRCHKHQDNLEYAIEKDHIIPITWEGSTNWISNIQPLCKSCNSSKNGRHSIDYRPDNVKILVEKLERRS